MAGAVSTKARSTLVFATALAMLLPLPARCAACSTNAHDCPRCAAAKAEPQATTAQRPCCKHRTTSPDQVCDTDSARSLSHHAPRCGCGVRPVHRTIPPKDQLPIGPDFDTAQPGPIETSCVAAQSAAIVYSHGDLPPPIAHRILHCSWLI